MADLAPCGSPNASRQLCRNIHSITSPRLAATASSTAGQGCDMVDEIVARAVAHVAEYGWTDAAVGAAVADLGLPSVSAGAVGDAAGLVTAFVRLCNRQLGSAEIAVADGVGEGDILRGALLARLALMLPHAATWPQALATLAQPDSSLTAATLLGETADAICSAVDARLVPPAGGSAASPTPRALRHATAATVYAASELYATQLGGAVGSDDARVTAFVDRRLAQAEGLRAAVPPEIPELLDGALAIGKNILGLPQRRE